MDIQKDNAILSRVWYPISGSTNNFVSTENPDELIFDASQLFIRYKHRGKITDLDGNFIKFTPIDEVVIETREVKYTYVPFGIKITSVTFNGWEYKA